MKVDFISRRTGVKGEILILLGYGQSCRSNVVVDFAGLRGHVVILNYVEAAIISHIC